MRIVISVHPQSESLNFFVFDTEHTKELLKYAEQEIQGFFIGYIDEERAEQSWMTLLQPYMNQDYEY